MASYHELRVRNLRSSLMLIGVVSALTVVGGYAIGFYFAGDNPYAPWIGLGIAGIIAGIQALFAWFGGANMVLRISGAREIGPDNAEFRQVYNIVEEMRIAAGLPMPRVYIIPDSSANAFATGRNPEDGRVAVTAGLVERLNREELQGVIAHEMAHIKNRDILFQTVVGIMVGMIVIISDIMLRSMFWSGFRGRGGNDRGGNQLQLIMMAVGLIFAILAPIGAVMLQLALSRQREFLADASGAEFTRNPEGLASALAKIAGDPTPMARVNRGTAHLFIVSPFKANARGGGGGLFATHPPIEKRVERLLSIGRTRQSRPT